MRSQQERDHVLELVAAGLNDCEIARAVDVPRSTIRDWRHGRFQHTPRRPTSGCPRCGAEPHDFETLDRPAYAYVLGIYLGDGHIARGARDVYRLRIYLDSRYPRLNQEVADAMETLMPDKTAHRQLHKSAAMVIIDMWSKQWPCLLPQHGPGKKHDRSIVLTDWQQRIVDEHHEELLRGLIHSDGCRHVNRVWHSDKAYEYTRYHFTNASADIRELFCASCDALGIPWRRMNARNISVARREGVARLEQFVGPKC